MILTCMNSGKENTYSSNIARYLTRLALAISTTNDEEVEEESREESPEIYLLHLAHLKMAGWLIIKVSAI